VSRWHYITTDAQSPGWRKFLDILVELVGSRSGSGDGISRFPLNPVRIPWEFEWGGKEWEWEC